MAKGATIVRVIYLDDEQEVDVLCGLGDMIIAADWAETEYPYPEKPRLVEGMSLAESDFLIEEYRSEKADVDGKREHRSGLYGCYLGAKRMGLRGTELGWEQWLQLVTVPGGDDEDDKPEAAEGESDGPSRED
jgi:hypothetical protein